MNNLELNLKPNDLELNLNPKLRTKMGTYRELLGRHPEEAAPKNAKNRNKVAYRELLGRHP